MESGKGVISISKSSKKKYLLKPEEDFSRSGIVIGKEREIAKRSSQVVSEGLCNESTLRRLEQGEIGCEKVLADALLERIGVSPARMLFYLNREEEEYFQTREKWIQAIHDGEWKEAETYQKQYQEQIECYHKLHWQFFLLISTAGKWEQYHKETKQEASQDLASGSRIWEEWLKALEKAWEITRKGYRLIEGQEERMPEQMTFQEVFVKSLYLRIREERIADQETIRGYFQVLRYLEEQVDAKDRLLLYPQITSRVLELSHKLPLASKEQETEQQRLLENCLEFLKREGGFCQLPELFAEKINYLEEEYEGELPLRIQKKVAEMKGMSKRIYWLYQEFQEPYPSWCYSLFFSLEEVYCTHAIISGRRKGYGWDRGELSDDVCSEKEVERIEKRQADPRMSTFQGLATKLRFPSGNGTLANQVGDPGLCHVMWEISGQTKFGRYEGVMEKLEILEEKADRSVYAKQNLIFLQQTTLYALEKISAEEHQERVWEALHMTMPEKGPEELKEWAFTRQEAMILNILAHSYDKLGRQEEGIAWMELLREYYESQPFAIEHYIDNYELVLENLGNMYGNIGEYEKALETGKVAIQLALRLCQGDNLKRLLYDYGWNMEHLWGKDGYTKEKSRLCIEAALDFARFYEIERSVKQFGRHLAEVYGKD